MNEWWVICWLFSRCWHGYKIHRYRVEKSMTKCEVLCGKYSVTLAHHQCSDQFIRSRKSLCWSVLHSQHAYSLLCAWNPSIWLRDMHFIGQWSRENVCLCRQSTNATLPFQMSHMDTRPLSHCSLFSEELLFLSFFFLSFLKDFGLSAKSDCPVFFASEITLLVYKTRF